MKEPHCPECGTAFVRVIHQPTMAESLLQLLRLYAYRCQLCTTQFRVFRPAVRDLTQAFDRRQYKRLPTSCMATLVTDLLSPREMVTDISMGGCSVRMESPLPLGTFLGLQFQTGERGPGITVSTAMVRSVRERSVGIQFLEMEWDQKTKLSQYVHGLLLSQGLAPEATT